MTLFVVKSYFSQTQVPDPKKSLGSGHRVFLPTLNDNDFKLITVFFVLEKSPLSVSISWVLGLGVLDWFKAKNGVYCNDLMLKMVWFVMILKIKQYGKDTKIYTSIILETEMYFLRYV